MKHKFLIILKLTGALILMFICGFLFFDLIFLVGPNGGIATLEVAGIFVTSLLCLIIIFKKSKGFNFSI